VSEGGNFKTELPSFLEIMGIDLHRHLLGVSLHEWVPVIMSLLVGILLILLSYIGTRRLEKVPRGSQALLEVIVEGLENFLRSVMGPTAPKYLPFIGTIFIYILTMNLWGLIPLMHSPTNKLNTTAALALVVFFNTHIQGAKKHGIINYAKHFADPLWLAPLMVPIHIVGELARPLSLALRLFGNLTGEDIAIAALVSLVILIPLFVPVPVHLFMVVLAILFSTIQAIVFTLLSAIYIASATGALEEE
jgi:F-type H+-transporting ATPase subunit a